MEEQEYKLNCRLKKEQKSFLFIVNHVKAHHFLSEPFNCEKSILNRYSCTSCQFEVDTIILLNEHMREHAVARKEETSAAYESQCYICHNCSFKSYSYLHWFKHAASGCPFVSFQGRRGVSNESEFVVTKNKVEIENLKTKNSPKVTEWSRDKKHFTDTEDKIWFKCEQCGYKTARKSNLKQHFNAQHADDENKKWFKCEQCAYKSTSRSNLKKHFNARHVDDKNKTYFKCEKCSYKARLRKDVKRHFLTHVADEDKTWFKCDQCEFKTTFKWYLKQHVNAQHVDDENKKCFRCEKCPYKTTKKNHLKQHFNAQHTDDQNKKWFKCEQCVYKTPYKSHVKLHFNKKHIDDKNKNENKIWFNCDKCVYKCTQKYHLNRHLIRRHAK